MLRKFFVLALILHFGEFTKIGRDYTSGSHITHFTQLIIAKIPLPINNVNRPQYPQFKPSSIDRPSVGERFDNIGNQASSSAFESDSYFLNQQNVHQPNQQSNVQQPNQQNNIQQQNQPPTNYNFSPSNYPQSPPSPALVPNNPNLHFMNDDTDTTTRRYQISFDRNSMTTSEESSQRPANNQNQYQRPSSDSFGDENNKRNQDDTSSILNGNKGIYRDPAQPNRQNLNKFTKPDENAIVPPNMPSNIIEIIFPPTLTYNDDDDVSTTTRASIFARRSSTTENYNAPSYT